MKIQIDTIEKVIKIEEPVSLKELFNNLEILLPNKQWEEYKLDVSVISNWNYPIIINPPIPFINPYQPFWQQPFITCCSNSITDSSIYNVEI